MNRVVLITGGAGSGKSRHGVERAKAAGKKVLFVATCVPGDAEMKAKVARHRAERPPEWRTVEATRDLRSVLAEDVDVALVDCLTLLVSRQLMDGASEADIVADVERLCEKPPCPLILVTNEVGSGIVPENALARKFREIAGRANQAAARLADEVVLMVSGVPVAIKGGR